MKRRPGRNRRRRSASRSRSGPHRRSSRPAPSARRSVRSRSELPRPFLLRSAASMSRSMGTGQTYAPDAAAIERLAEATIARLPAEFRAHLTKIVLRIEDFADDAVLDAMGIEDPFELSGLYSGRPMSEESAWVSA